MKRRRSLLTLVVAPLLVGFTWPWTLGQLTNEGRAKWADGDFGGAQAAFDQARAAGGDRAALIYNQGTAQLAAGDNAAALETLSQVQTADPQLQAAAHYNRGNALYGLDQLDAAAEAYEASLALRPDDADAQHNLELCRRRQKQAQPDQNKQPPPPQQQQQQPNGGQQQQPPSQPANEPNAQSPSNPQDTSDTSDSTEVRRKMSQLDAEERADRDVLRLRPRGDTSGPFDRDLRGLWGSSDTQDW